MTIGLGGHPRVDAIHGKMRAVLSANFVFVGAALVLAGDLSYVRDTLARRVQPNRVSWLLWGAATILVGVAQVRQGVGLQSALGFAIGLGDLLVFGVSYLRASGVWRLGRFDLACGVASAAGLVVWGVTGNNALALASFIAADAFATIPTLVKSWTAPDTESLLAYSGAAASGLITLGTVKVWSGAAVSFSIWIALVNLVLVFLIRTRVGPKVRAYQAGLLALDE